MVLPGLVILAFNYSKAHLAFLHGGHHREHKARGRVNMRQSWQVAMVSEMSRSRVRCDS